MGFLKGIDFDCALSVSVFSGKMMCFGVLQSVFVVTCLCLGVLGERSCVLLY